jgi:hypothetical protein
MDGQVLRLLELLVIPAHLGDSFRDYFPSPYQHLPAAFWSARG